MNFELSLWGHEQWNGCCESSESEINCLYVPYMVIRSTARVCSFCVSTIYGPIQSKYCVIAGFTCCRISWFPNTWKSVSSLYLSPSRRHCLASSSLTVRGWKCQAEWWKQSLLRVSAPPTHKTHRKTHFKLDATAVDSEEKLNCHHCKNPWEHDKKIYIFFDQLFHFSAYII